MACRDGGCGLLGWWVWLVGMMGVAFVDGGCGLWGWWVWLVGMVGVACGDEVEISATTYMCAWC